MRNDLAETYRIVQGSHALAQFALEFNVKFRLWNNSTIIFLATRNLIELKEFEIILNRLRKDFTSFREPDLNGQLTAIACYDNGQIFKNLRTA